MSSSSFEKSVKGGTKVKLAPPKSKYVEHILLATQSGDAGVAEVFRTLTQRLRDSTWTVAFKSLIIVHLMIKEGALDVTLRYLAVAPQHRLAINSFTDVQTQGQNIRVYSDYLLARARGYEKFKCDHARSGEGRMKRLSVDKGLLRETEVVQDEIRALIKCDLLSNETENEISLTAFRLLTRDLLDLYNVVNEAVMSVLSHYFEMSRPDAERAVKIYKKFCTQTEQVVQYLSVARRYEYATRLQIPKLKHAPTSLAKSLQEYLNDPDFEAHRKEYLAEQEAKRNGKPVSRPAQPKAQTSAAKAPTPFDNINPAPSTASASNKGPAPDLIDFFESIESNQQTMATNPFLQQHPQQPQPQFQPQQQFPNFQAPQPTGFQQQFPPQQSDFSGLGVQANHFRQTQSQHQQQPLPPQQPMQPQFTGAGFGGYGAQPSQQQPLITGNAFASEPQSYMSPVQQQPPAQLQPQPTNPFRQSSMPVGASSAYTGSPFAQLQPQQPERQGTNPFSRSTLPAAIPENGMPQQQSSPFAPQQQQQQHPSPFQTQPLQAQPTGTNPFARNPPTQQQPPMPSLLQMQPTGSTNPFRQSQFVNQQTGQGWQHGPQGTMGGLEQLPTIPVFPRPGQMSGQQQQQQQQQSPWA